MHAPSLLRSGLALALLLGLAPVGQCEIIKIDNPIIYVTQEGRFKSLKELDTEDDYWNLDNLRHLLAQLTFCDFNNQEIFPNASARLREVIAELERQEVGPPDQVAASALALLPLESGESKGHGSRKRPSVEDPDPPPPSKRQKVDQDEGKEVKDDQVVVRPVLTAEFSSWGFNENKHSQETCIERVDHNQIPFGKGLKARTGFKRGEIITWYTGSVLTFEEFTESTRPYGQKDWKLRPELQNFITFVPGSDQGLKDQWVLDGSNQGDPGLAWCANHAPDTIANAKPYAVVVAKEKTDPKERFKVALVATKDITAGHEILIDYGHAYAQEVETSLSYKALKPESLAQQDRRTAEPENPTGGTKVQAIQTSPSSESLTPSSQAQMVQPSANSQGNPVRSTVNPPTPTDSCPNCKKKITKSYLPDHVAQCTGAPKTFECKEDNCTKKFETEKLLKRHVKNSHKFIPKKCSDESCGKTFKTSRALRDHITRIHDKNLFACLYDRCRSTFKTLEDRDKHHKLLHTRTILNTEKKE